MAWQRVAAWVESQRLDTMRRFERARVEADHDLALDGGAGRDDLTVSQRAAILRLEADLDASAGRFAVDEIALALNMSVASVDKQMRLAHDLHGVHRDLGEALELGQVSAFVASMIAQAPRGLPYEARRLLDPAVTSDAVEQPAGRAIDAARARVGQLDTDADAAAVRAVKARHVFLKPMDDGVAMLGAVMPAADAVSAYRRLDNTARARRADGDDRTLDQLRCDGLATLLLGPAPDHPDRQLDDVPDAPAETQPVLPVAAPVAVQVVISLTSLLGLDSRSAQLDGYGTISAGAARALFASGHATLTRLLCAPDTGAVVHADPTVYTPTSSLRHTVGCRDRHCRMPVCHARVVHLDHIKAAVDTGLTTPDNLQGLCLRSHLTKHHPGWTVVGDADGVVKLDHADRPPLPLHATTGHRPRHRPTGRPDTPTYVPGWFSREQHDSLLIQAWRKPRAA